MSEHDFTTRMISRLYTNPALALSSYPEGCRTIKGCVAYKKAALLNEPNAAVALKALAAYYNGKNKEDKGKIVKGNVHSFCFDVMTQIATQYPEMVLRVDSENRGLVDEVVLQEAHFIKARQSPAPPPRNLAECAEEREGFAVTQSMKLPDVFPLIMVPRQPAPAPQPASAPPPAPTVAGSTIERAAERAVAVAAKAETVRS